MPTLSSHACFRCRKVFKKPHEYSVTPTERRCPECGGIMVAMGYKFRAPRATNIREWSRIETAIREGRPWEIPTVRKVKPKPKVDPKLLKALGTRRTRRAPSK